MTNDKKKKIQTLLSVANKLFTYVTESKISKTLDLNQTREQAGFRRGYSRKDHIHVLSKVVKKSGECNHSLCMIFIDYEKTFDSVNIQVIMQAIRRQGIDKPYLKALKDILSQHSNQ